MNLTGCDLFAILIFIGMIIVAGIGIKYRWLRNGADHDDE